MNGRLLLSKERSGSNGLRYLKQIVFPLFFPDVLPAGLLWLESRTGRNSYQSCSFFLRHLFANAESILILCRKYLIVNGSVQHPEQNLRRYPGSCGLLRFALERTGEVAGSTATTFTFGFCFFRYSPVPVIVPPVPTPAEESNCSVRIVPDLRTGGLKVYFWICRIYKLSRDSCSGSLCQLSALQWHLHSLTSLR